jgi:hypothetical protein
MDRVYRIAKWLETFETSDSRRNKTLSWVSWPLDSTNGYNDLVETFGDEAPLIYGAWCALVRFAAKTPERGTLADSRGRAIPLSRIAAEARFPISCFERLVEWASLERVSWLEDGSCPGVAQDSTGRPHVNGTPTVPYRTGPNPTDPTDDRSIERPADDVCYQAMQVGGELWESLRERMQSVLDALKPSPTYRAAPKDVALVARGVILEARVSVDLIDGILESIGELGEHPKRPYGYFKKSLMNACLAQGIDFHRATRAIKLPHQQPARAP